MAFGSLPLLPYPWLFPNRVFLLWPWPFFW